MINNLRRAGRVRLSVSAVLGILLASQGSIAAVHTVNQTGLIFAPADITIAVGDTVNFVWSSGFHTVTNGTGANDGNVGSLFDASLDSLNPTFSHTFTSAGDVPYFCRPHEIFAMAGIVHVAGGSPVPMLPGGPALLIVALLAGSLPWMRKLLRARGQST
jgi:plastocyanin